MVKKRVKVSTNPISDCVGANFFSVDPDDPIAVARQQARHRLIDESVPHHRVIGLC